MGTTFCVRLSIEQFEDVVDCYNRKDEARTREYLLRKHKLPKIFP